MPENHGRILIVDDEVPVLGDVAKPLDFRYLDRTVSSGLVQAGGAASAPRPAAAPANDPWKRELSGIEVAVGAASKTPRAG